MPALKAIHHKDPRLEIIKRVGDLSWFRLRTNQILVAIYIAPPERQYRNMKLLVTDKTRDEDRYQGKIGLIIKMGPTAFVDDEQTHFLPEDKAALHDWVVFRASDGWQLTLTGDGSEETKQPCRVFVESDIRAIVSDPDAVW